MSLFDDWDSQEAKYVSSGTVAGGGDPTSTLAASVAFDAGREDTELEQPLFTVELVEQSVSRQDLVARHTRGSSFACNQRGVKAA